MVFIMYLVRRSHIRILALLLIFICGCQTEADWFRARPTVEPIKVYSYDDELQAEQLKYDDMGIWLVDYLKLTNYILN
jgi:hypothetical protein